MMDGTVLFLVGIVLLAILIGLLIPVLLQLRATLKSAQTFLDTTSRQIDGVLGDVKHATAKVNRLTDEMQGSAEHARRLLGTVQPLIEDVERLRGALRVASAVGPAAFAAVKSFVSSFTAPHPGDAEDESSDRPEGREPRYPNRGPGAAAG